MHVEIEPPNVNISYDRRKGLITDAGGDQASKR